MIHCPVDPGHEVLVVDDSVDDVLLLRRTLRKAGLESLLQVCIDGEEALEYLGCTGRYSSRLPAPPALVFLDWKLPRKNGLEVLHWIRAQASLGNLTVVVISASGQREEIELALAAGASAYVHKPMDVNRFRELVRELNVEILQRYMDEA